MGEELGDADWSSWEPLFWGLFLELLLGILATAYQRGGSWAGSEPQKLSGKEDWAEHSVLKQQRGLWAGSFCREDPVLFPLDGSCDDYIIMHLLICLQTHYTYLSSFRGHAVCKLLVLCILVKSCLFPSHGRESEKQKFQESISGCWVKAVDSGAMNKLWLQKNTTRTVGFNFFPNQFIKIIRHTWCTFLWELLSAVFVFPCLHIVQVFL